MCSTQYISDLILCSCEEKNCAFAVAAGTLDKPSEVLASSLRVVPGIGTG